MSLVPSHQARGANARAVYPGLRALPECDPVNHRDCLASAPASLSSANGTGYSALAAAATFTTLPLMVYFLLLPRQFIRGALSAAGSIR